MSDRDRLMQAVVVEPDGTTTVMPGFTSGMVEYWCSLGWHVEIDDCDGEPEATPYESWMDDYRDIPSLSTPPCYTCGRRKQITTKHDGPSELHCVNCDARQANHWLSQV